VPNPSRLFLGLGDRMSVGPSKERRVAVPHPGGRSGIVYTRDFEIGRAHVPAIVEPRIGQAEPLHTRQMIPLS
jgi:hypothetical protein